jgi:hypothetical protein
MFDSSVSGLASFECVISTSREVGFLNLLKTTLILCDDREHYIASQGNVEIKYCNDKSFEFQKVFYIPMLSKNPFPIKDITSHSPHLVCYLELANVFGKTRNGEVIALGIKKHRMLAMICCSNRSLDILIFNIFLY